MWAIGSNLGATLEMGAQRNRGYLATGGTEGYSTLQRGTEGWVHYRCTGEQERPGIAGYKSGYKVRPLPSCSFPQHKYTSIRDAATHTQEKSSITYLAKIFFIFPKHTLAQLQSINKVFVFF